MTKEIRVKEELKTYSFCEFFFFFKNREPERNECSDWRAEGEGVMFRKGDKVFCIDGCQYK